MEHHEVLMLWHQRVIMEFVIQGLKVDVVILHLGQISLGKREKGRCHCPQYPALHREAGGPRTGHQHIHAVSLIYI